MQPHLTGQMPLQLLPDADGQVLGRTHFARQDFHIHIQVFMIHLFNYLLFNDLAELLHNRTGTPCPDPDRP